MNARFCVTHDRIGGYCVCLNLANDDTMVFGYFGEDKPKADQVAANFNALAQNPEIQVAKLQAFKDYVHKRLDDAGVPKDPLRGAECRIGARLDWLFKEANHG